MPGRAGCGGGWPLNCSDPVGDIGGCWRSLGTLRGFRPQIEVTHHDEEKEIKWPSPLHLENRTAQPHEPPQHPGHGLVSVRPVVPHGGEEAGWGALLHSDEKRVDRNDPNKLVVEFSLKPSSMFR